MRVHVLHCGWVQIDKALAFREHTLHPAPHTGWLRNPAAQIWLPVHCYLIEHEKGLILVDTGWNDAVRGDQVQYFGGYQSSLSRADLPPGHAVHERLNELGHQPADLDAVIITHLHSDHAGGVAHILDAKQILVSDIEYQAVNKISPMWHGVDFQNFLFSRSNIGPKNHSCDLFGDGTIQLIHTPGHTDGLTSVLVNGAKGFLLIYADVGYACRSWQQGILPGITSNEQDARKSLNWVRETSLNPECILSLASHESCAERTINL